MTPPSGISLDIHAHYPAAWHEPRYRGRCGLLANVPPTHMWRKWRRFRPTQARVLVRSPHATRWGFSAISFRNSSRGRVLATSPFSSHPRRASPIPQFTLSHSLT